jgi:hypothetical protein
MSVLRILRLGALLSTLLLMPATEARADFCSDWYDWLDTHCQNVCTMGCSCVGESCQGWAEACEGGERIECFIN